jgi:DNA repair protein RecO (recombination protein O)
MDAETHAFLTEAIGRPLAQVPVDVGQRVLRQAERAISDTVEHHANTRLRSATSR